MIFCWQRLWFPKEQVFAQIWEKIVIGSADVTPEMSSIHGVFQKSALRQRSQLINVFSG